MNKWLCLILLSVLIIPQGISWQTYLSMFPELKEIVKVESNFNPDAVHVNKNGTRDCGLFQINDVHGISCYKRKDPWFSLMWAIEKYYDDELHIWSTYKLLVKTGKIFID